MASSSRRAPTLSGCERPPCLPAARAAPSAGSSCPSSRRALLRNPPTPKHLASSPVACRLPLNARAPSRRGARQYRVRRSARCPDESSGLNHLACAELDSFFGKHRNPSLDANLHAAFRLAFLGCIVQVFRRVRAELPRPGEPKPHATCLPRRFG